MALVMPFMQGLVMTYMEGLIMLLNTALKEFIVEMQIRKYTPRTIKGYKNNISRWIRFLEEHDGATEIEELSMADVKVYTRYLVNANYKGTYINGILKNVKSFIQYHYEEGNGGFNTKKNFKWVKEKKPIIEAFKPNDIKLLLKHTEGHGYLEVRDRAIITMFLETGIRNTELCCIKPEDIHDDYILIAEAKNHKQRVVPITPVLRKALMKYDHIKEYRFAGTQTDNYYFLSFRGSQLTKEANLHILKNRGKGIEGIRVSPHTCRHFFAQQHVKMGTDLYTISRLLGHENIKITQTYLDSLRNEDIIEMTKNNSVIMNMK